MYAMVQTRPDTAFAVQWLSRQLQQPTVAYFKATKKLLSYLFSNTDQGICFSTSTDLTPVGYTDSDFAEYKTTAKSIYGYLFIVGGGLISWKSKRSSTVTYSTLEAEFTGLIKGNREAIWLRGLFSELKRPIQRPIPLIRNNKGAINTTHNPKHHNRTKHTLLKYQRVKESVTEGNITVTYIPTGEIPANGLTKALTPAKHKQFLRLLNLSRLCRLQRGSTAN